MNKLKQKLILLCGSAALLLAGFDFAVGQGRTVRVYRSSTYNRTRRLMSDRAVVKKTIRKVVKKRPVKKKRRPS